MTRYQGITHITTGGISPILPNLNNLKDQLPEIALAHHNTAFNSAMKCTPFEAMYDVWLKSQNNNRGKCLSKTAHNCRRGHRAHRAPRA